MLDSELDTVIRYLEGLKEDNKKGYSLEIPNMSYVFNMMGEVTESGLPHYGNEMGHKRMTKEACELAAKRIGRVNRLSLLAHILGVEQEFEEGIANYYIYKSIDDNKWKANGTRTTSCPDRVYMTQDGADRICTILNNDEWDLEVGDEPRTVCG